jgi:hypothetical protein
MLIVNQPRSHLIRERRIPIDIDNFVIRTQSFIYHRLGWVAFLTFLNFEIQALKKLWTFTILCLSHLRHRCKVSPSIEICYTLFSLVTLIRSSRYYKNVKVNTEVKLKLITKVLHVKKAFWTKFPSKVGCYNGKDILPPPANLHHFLYICFQRISFRIIEANTVQHSPLNMFIICLK